MLTLLYMDYFMSMIEEDIWYCSDTFEKIIAIPFIVTIIILTIIPIILDIVLFPIEILVIMFLY